MSALTNPPTPSDALTQELRLRDQQLLDAIAPGDVKVWDAALAADAVYVDENGEIIHRADFLKQLQPLPPGVSGKLTISAYTAQQSGEVAMVIHTDDEEETYHGQHLTAQYLMTETWQRQNGGWKLLLVHAYSVLKEPKPILLPATDLDAYVAAYQVLAGTGGLTAKALVLPVKLYDPADHYDNDSGRWFGLGD